MSSMKILYLCLIVIHSLVYGSRVPWVVSKIHIMSLSSGFCIWIHDVAGRHRKSPAARRLPGGQGMGHTEHKGCPTAQHVGTQPPAPQPPAPSSALATRWAVFYPVVRGFTLLSPINIRGDLFCDWCCMEPPFLLKDSRSLTLSDSLELSLQSDLINLRPIVTSFIIH